MAAPAKPAARKAAPKPGPGKSGSKAAPRKAAPPRSDMRLVIWVAAAIFVIDQVLKYVVVHMLQLDRVREIDVLPPWLNLRMAWNQGVNFGLMASDASVMRWVLIGIALVICVWVWVWIWRSQVGRLARVSAGLLIGGALGNVIDRILYGAVADFLNMSLPGWQNPYSFNVADISIFAGAIGLVLMPTPAATKSDDKARKAPAKPPRPAPKPAAAPGPAAPGTPRQAELFPAPDQQGRDGDGKPG
ncbi:MULTISPECIES: signal peptidase II [Paracoccus]|uniref:signal peptidase II n=1 Tax=Paracoccus TaxID=265 RepID=UPI000B2C6529|nr:MULTISPECIES: signal peptidase II [Paracoccus]